MVTVKNLVAHEILGGNGLPALEAHVFLSSGEHIISKVSTDINYGEHAASPLLDDSEHKISLSSAVYKINNIIAPHAKDFPVQNHLEFDQWMIDQDGTDNLARLGANTCLLVSQLLCKAAAASYHIPLFQYINGLYNHSASVKVTLDKLPNVGVNFLSGSKTTKSIDFVGIYLSPASSWDLERSYKEIVSLNIDFYRATSNSGIVTSFDDRGKIIAHMNNNEEALKFLVDLLKARGLRPGLDMFFGLDVKASQFSNGANYQIKEKSTLLKKEDYFNYLVNLVNNYPIIILNDPVYPNDWDGWKIFNEMCAKKTDLYGEQIIGKRKDYLSRAIEKDICNGYCFNLQSIGTVNQAIDLINLAKMKSLPIAVSTLPIEVDDTFVVDFAVGIGADKLIIGNLHAFDQGSKLDRLRQINKAITISNAQQPQASPK